MLCCFVFFVLRFFTVTVMNSDGLSESFEPWLWSHVQKLKLWTYLFYDFRFFYFILKNYHSLELFWLCYRTWWWWWWLWWWWWWWWWLVFVVWLIDKMHLAVFSALPSTHHVQGLNLRRTWVQALLNKVVQQW